MTWWARIRRRDQLEAQLDAELRDHFERQVADSVRDGVPEDEARRRARLDFGGLDQVKEDCRDARGTLWVESILQDAGFALRMLRKTPGFALAALCTLALGVGANSAIFSVVYAVLLKPLPYAEPDQLVTVAGVIPQLRAKFPSLGLRARDFLELRRSNAVFSGIAALRPQDFSLTGEGEPERLSGARVSANLFALFGVQPEIGRTFLPEEDQPGRDQVIVISHDLWVRRFASDPGVLRRTVSLDGRSFVVAGVMPAGFLFPTGSQLNPVILLGPRVDVWKPLALTSREAEHRGNWAYALLARLKPGVSPAQARQNTDAIAARFEFPDGRTKMETQILPLREAFSGRVRQGLLLLLGAVGLLLLIACVNLANLLLARMSVRAREFATRAALGAPRGRLARQLLTESVTIALLGGAAGLVAAHWGTRLLISLGPADSPNLGSSHLDGPMLLFTLALALVTGVAFGLFPALECVRGGLYDNLAARGATAGRRTGRLRHALVTAEVALATALVAVSGLLLHSFVRVMGVDKGFAVERILSAELALPGGSYSPERTAQFYRQLTERVRALPGVVSAGAISAPPLGAKAGRGENGPVYFESDLTSDRTPERPFAAFPSATRGAFATLGIPLLAGRLFEEEEPAPATVVSAGLARRLWPGDPPSAVVGRRIKLNSPDFAPVTIVGVVGDVRGEALEREPGPVAYRPLAQAVVREMTLALRTALEPQALAQAVRGEVATLDRNLPVTSIRTMRQIVSASVAQRRFQMTLILVFAALSLALAAVGIYGVTSYSVARQTREIGVRIALGARPAQVLGSALTDGLRPVAAGLLLGLGGAVAAGVSIRGLLYGVEPLDPASLAGGSAVLLLVAALACYVPARRACAIDPLAALRCE